jgi:8-oxo-dGTP pyrophosphatase MutT (NUDIX family)
VEEVGPNPAPGQAPREPRAVPVRAAGGIVSRARDGALEVPLVHRPAYDDWTFPKGKAEPGESDEACALREVEEETGLACALEGELGETGYIDPKGREKVVRWYAMRPLRGEFAPHKEIDDARWLGLEAAAAALTYDRDRELLSSFASSR